MHRRKHVHVLFGILMLPLLFAACGSSTSGTSSVCTTGTPMPTTTPSGSGGSSVSIVIHANAGSVDPLSKSSISATCDPTDEQLIGGGFTLDTANSQFNVMESYPSDLNTWTIFPRNTTTSAHQATAYAICVRNGPPLRRYIVTGAPMTYTRSSTGLPFATASCGSDIGTSAGFYFSPTGGDGPNNVDPDGAITVVSIHSDTSGVLTSDHQWELGGQYQPEVAGASGSVDLTPVVYCVGAAHLSTANFPFHAAFGTDVSVTTSNTECVAGSMIIGGFFGLDGPDPWIVWQMGETSLSFTSMPLTRWVVSAHGTSTILGIKSGAICGTFF